MKILVGSKNPAKIKSVESGFIKFFEDVILEGISVPSGVSDQPMSEEETLQGARQRAEKLKEKNDTENLSADFFVGVEGGVRKVLDMHYAFGCICIIDHLGRMSFGNSSDFLLPESVAQRLVAGEELGVVIDELLGQENVKQKGGAIGYFTKGVMPRSELYVDDVVTALIPFLNEELYFLNDA